VRQTFRVKVPLNNSAVNCRTQEHEILACSRQGLAILAVTVQDPEPFCSIDKNDTGSD